MQNCLCVHPLISLFRVRLLATHASLALRLWYSSTGVWSSLKIHCFSDLSKHTLLPIPFSWHVSSWNRSRVHRVLRKTLILESLSFSDVICPDKWSSLHTMLLLLWWIFFFCLYACTNFQTQDTIATSPGQCRCTRHRAGTSLESDSETLT